MAQTSAPTALAPAAAAEARWLREQFGFLRDVVAEMERRVPYAAALARFGEGDQLELRDGEQSASRLDTQSGIVLTASNGHALEEAATDAVDPDAVQALARDLVDRVTARPAEDGQPALDIVPDSPSDGDYATPLEIDPASVPLLERVARYEDLRQRLRAQDERAVQALAIHRASRVTSVFANRIGLTTQQISRVLLRLLLYVSDGEQRQFDTLTRAATGGLEHLGVTDADLAECAATAAALLSAGSLPPGTYEVVADPQTSGIIAHEAFGHGVETDMFVKQRARAAAYVGKRVGSELVNCVDDPTYPGGYGSYYVDDEGQIARPTQIIRDGIFQRGITDLYSATRLGISRTANGRRESVQRKAYARMSNTFFAGGKATREELIGGIDHGFELCDALNGMEDPKGWGMQIWSHYAREIRGGRPTGTLFTPVALTGYVPDVLSGVSGVSSTVTFEAGTCGKGWKELVPVGSGGPYLRTRMRLA